MSKKKKLTKKKVSNKSEPAEPKGDLALTSDGFALATMDEAWRFAKALSDSDLVPTQYKGKPADCLVALDLAMRLGAPWLAIMQHVYTVKGRPAMDAALSTGLVNRSGMFTDPLDYEVVGDDAERESYKVRAFATRARTGKVLYGPWITWKLVKAEGWYSKDGSKWKTMPEQMFHYRAASWFQRRHCPELTMGMLTTDEAAELPPQKHVKSTVVDISPETLKNDLDKSNSEQPEQNTEGRPANIQQKVDRQKTELKASGNRKKSNLFGGIGRRDDASNSIKSE